MICAQTGIFFQILTISASCPPISNTLIFSILLICKGWSYELSLFPPINFWFSVNNEVDKAGEAGVEVAVTAESILGWQSKPNIWNQNSWISSWRMSYIHIINCFDFNFYQKLNQAEEHFFYWNGRTERLELRVVGLIGKAGFIK